MEPCGRFVPLFALAGTLLFAQSPGAQFYTVEKELALGRQMAEDARKRLIPVNNAEVQDYAAQVGRRLVAQVKSPIAWSFEVMAGLPSNPTHEPLEFPGGFVFLSADLMLAARDEDEFAGMLAHSIAHGINGGLTRMASFGQVSNYGTIPLIFVGGWHDGLALPKAYLPMARSLESDADTTAVGILKRAGYDPQALVRYIARVQPETLPGHFAVPQRDERITGLQSAIRKLGPNEFAKVQEYVREQSENSPARKAPSLFQ